MSKICIICKEQNENLMLKYCRKCYYGEVIEIKKSQKKIKPISERKKRRIKEMGSETEFFLSIWNSRPRQCEECKKELHEPKPHNFDHIKGKGINEDKRYDPNNIQILCFACHFKKTTGLNYKGIEID